MKATKIFLFLFATSLAMTSCKREYACDCHYDEIHDDHTHHKDVSYPLGKLSKKDAESKCEEKETALMADPDNKDVHCEVKK
jgi:hypothetical protein